MSLKIRNIIDIAGGKKNKIKKEVSLLKENVFNLNKEDIFKNSNDELVLLENIRFYPEEEANDDKFSKKLAPNFYLLYF